MLKTIITNPITINQIIIILIAALAMGLACALIFSYKHKLSSSLALTLVILPIAMSMVVIMINGNLGIAVSVAGGFTLVRFRSIAGTGREISGIFTVMCIGVILGVGYIGAAAIFLAIIAITVIGLTTLHFGEETNEKILRITIPEDYDYADLFDEVFKKYDIKAEPIRIKTTNLGSLIEVSYKIESDSRYFNKQLLDELRCLNANLAIVVSSVNYETDNL